jgi:GAF domain-containing protein
MYRQSSDNTHSLLASEGQLLELISEGAPLPQILDRVCSAIDIQLGNVVSMVLLPDDPEHTLHTFEQSAVTFGLTPFCCAPILSPEAEFLGTLETYCCFPRKPSLSESALIEQAAQLAAVAIQHFNLDVRSESCSLDWNGLTRGSPHEGPPSTN